MTNIEKVIAGYYRRNPIEYLENSLSIKFNWFQKFLIKLAFKGVKMNRKENK